MQVWQSLGQPGRELSDLQGCPPSIVLGPGLGAAREKRSLVEFSTAGGCQPAAFFVIKGQILARREIQVVYHKRDVGCSVIKKNNTIRNGIFSYNKHKILPFLIKGREVISK